MTLFRVFLDHELTMQWRSMRFRGLAAVYILAASIPPVVAFAISGRMPRIMGPSAYNIFLLTMQPLLTALLAAGLAVDAIARERDEGSFSVLSVAPISSVGYVLLRWLALVVICIPVSLVPTAITAALGAHSRYTLPLAPVFFEGWLVSVLPSLLVSSALAIALGTITGRTVLAIIFGALLITAGIGFANYLLFYLHLDFDGPGELFAGGSRSMQELLWTIRGNWPLRVPSDAAFPLWSEGRKLLGRAGITAAMTIVLLAAAAFYLRRTLRDLRPWNIRKTHPVATLLGTLNRIRQEFAPDSGSSTRDRTALTVAIVLAALLTGSIIHQQSVFAALAAARYTAETEQAAVPASTSLVAESVRIDGEISVAGTLRSHTASIIRNGGERGETHLSFVLNPGVAVRRMAVDRGTARMRRVWERLDVEIDPPLMPRQSRTLTFDLEGLPATIDFALQAPGNFRAQWNRYRTAKESIYMTDLSKSSVNAAATEVRMHLRGRDLSPVLRYSPWTLAPDEQDGGFTPESIMPPAALDVRLKHPYALAVDACGAVSDAHTLVSRCTAGLASYVVFGGPLMRRALAGSTLVYIPAHELLADVQAQSLTSSIRLAGEAWPGLALPSHLIFVERPTEPNQRRWYFDYQPWRNIEQVGSGGLLFFVPEAVFTMTKAVSPNIFAASIIAGTLRSRRAVVSDQAGFFTRFYTAIAIGRLGMRRTTAVEPGTGFAPETAPLLNEYYRPESRMSKVLAAIEYRAGASHFVEGVTDFVKAGGPPDSAKELLDAIGRRAGLDLTRTYEDYFAGSALPQLTLDEVTFHHAGGRWEISGAVRNVGTGEAFVPVALRTSQGSLWQTVRVDSGGRTMFAFSAGSDPHSVQLDPDGVCYRHAAVGLIENVEYRGPS
ncbi:MAG TPA: hypothetical protein VGQ46_15500 [Thermoanaerobaculia bacterium]|jgi:ABC-type transport system involved in multi-copper enzyme maturation permease subunit|nr:hypothetical protein [Thermoanaerobaculia bacterium]